MGLTKDRRDRLFRHGKPLVRPFEPIKDMWVLWAAYDLGSFKTMPQGLTKAQFRDLVMTVAKAKSSCLVIEDTTKHFKEGKGPVGFITIDNYGWRVEPQADFFMWATPRMILRCNVAFFQMVRYSKDIGVCLVRSLESTANLFKNVKKYGLLYEVGKIPHGTPNGDEYIFSINGLKKA